MDEKILEKKLKRGFFAASLLGFLIVAVGITTVMILNHSRSEMVSLAMENRTEEFAVRIRQKVESSFQALETLAAFINGFGLMEEEQFASSLQEANRNNDFLSMACFGQDGRGVSTKQDQEEIERLRISDLHEESRKVAEKGLQGESTLSGIFDSTMSSSRVFVYGVPLHRDGQVIGTLMASEAASAFAEVLGNNGTFAESDRFHLIQSDGSFLMQGGNTVIPEETQSIFRSEYFSQEEKDKIRAAMEKGKSALSSFEHEGREYFVFLYPVGINGWYVFCSNTGGEASGAAYQMVWITVGTLAAILLLSVVLVLLSYRMMYRSHKDLTRMAYGDRLTGARNLLRFRQMLSALVEAGGSGSVAALNVRQFKFINEIFGRDFADQLLCGIKESIEAELSPEEFFCRDSADLFYLYLKDRDRKRVEERIGSVMRRVGHFAIDARRNYQVLLYAGVVAFDRDTPYENETGDDLLTHVLFALATARTLPSNSVWFYSTERHKDEEMENYVESHMHQALEQGEFRLFLQPKFDLKTDTLGGAEALVRWITGEGRTIYPNQFIPLFEENGFCEQLDLYMVEQACRQIRWWMDHGYTPVPISINQSKRLFYKTDYIESLRGLTERYRVPAELLTLEILEGLALENVQELNERIRQLHELGFRVSMDDFGSGYSSLNTLGNLQIDELKLDQGFLFAISKEENSRFRIIMENIAGLTRSLQISTVVEGVETEENVALIKELNCDFGQGYFYSRPIPAEEFHRVYVAAEK